MVNRRPKKIEVKIKNKKKSGKAEAAVILEKETNEDVEKEKLLLMRVGVACVMVVFFVGWIFNLKYQFKINSNNNGKSSFNWEQTKAELDRAMNQIKQGVAEIKQIQATQPQNTLPRESELTSAQIDLLKGKLMGEMASSTVASSTSVNK
ncbi:MAG: hypothetical protein PHF50_02360 [Patescibacteria group bacterium]|nr:hypothetical protein [Patescibacteria group bacterium]